MSDTRKDAPERIYLNDDGDYDAARPRNWEEDGVTWSSEPIGDNDTEYVRADLHATITAELERVKAEQVEDTKSLVRLLDTVKYLRGIAEKGLGRTQREDETVEQFVLGYVKELEAVKAESEARRVDALRVDAMRVDAERYRWLTHDHDELETRRKVKTIAESIDIRGKGNTDAAIDAAREKGVG